MNVRALERGDVPEVARMMRRYLREAYEAEWHGSDASLSADAADGAVHLLVAARPAGGLAGFVAWTDDYDLHHCMRGGTIADLFVEPDDRGRGLAVQLIAAAAAEIRAGGGRFLKAEAVEHPAVRRLYARAAVCRASVGCTVSGRAFRRVAELAGSSPRRIARALPDPAWNYEA